MSLIDAMSESCTMLDKVTTSDGLGGFMKTWTDGAKFKAAIVKDSTMAARVAENEGVTEVYTVTVPRGIMLDLHDVFRRDSDGATFRVTSNIHDSHTPTVATFQFGQVTAERWVLT